MRTRGIILLLLVMFSLSAQSQSRRQELEKQRKTLSAEIEKITRRRSENAKSIWTVRSNLELIFQQIDTRKKLVAVLEKEIQALDEEILFKETQVQKLDKDLQEKKDNYALSVQKLYQQKNNQGQLLFILSADNLAQSFRRMLYLKEYAGWQKQQAEQIAAQQQKITIEKQALLADKQAKEELIDTKKVEEDHLHKEENARKTEEANLQKNAKTLQAEIDKKKKQTAALDQEINKIIAAEIAKSKKAAKTNPQVVRKAETAGGYAMTKEEQKLSANFAENKGKLPSPVTGNPQIVGRFGQQQYGGGLINSNGIDIKTASGNSAKAVFDGVITVITVYRLLTVVIRHGDYLTVYSGLEKLSVKQGDKVKTGQTIGKIYTDEHNETVLHFELWKGETKQNPEPWLGR